MENLEALQDSAKIAKLPQEGVHCYAASSKQINTRRIVTVILFVAFVALAALFILGKTQSIPLGVMSCVAAIISLLVFIQTFLIAKYRVAVDYNMKRIVLRYRFSLITIPFESFDARDGEADKAEALLNSVDASAPKVCYLVLDDVFDEACYQTSTKDLASREDFFKLKEDCFAIAEAYGARNSDSAIKPNTAAKSVGQIKKSDATDADLDAIVEDALDVDDKKEE